MKNVVRSVEAQVTTIKAGYEEDENDTVTVLVKWPGGCDYVDYKFEAPTGAFNVRDELIIEIRKIDSADPRPGE